MNVKSLLSLVLFATLTGPLALAQQPSGPPQGGPGRAGGGPHSAWGGPGGPGFHLGPPGMWWHNPDLIQKLNLTPDQQKQMDEILQQSRPQLMELRSALQKQEFQMRPMLSANPPDTNKILAQIDQTAQARAELEKATAKMLLGIRNLLTPDQWTRLQEEERNHRTNMMDHHPGGPGAPTGPGGGGEGMK